MPDEAQKDVVQLAEQVAEGFAALSGEYQILFDQQKQLESKLSWAKQQVSCDRLGRSWTRIHETILRVHRPPFRAG